MLSLLFSIGLVMGGGVSKVGRVGFLWGGQFPGFALLEA